MAKSISRRRLPACGDRGRCGVRARQRSCGAGAQQTCARAIFWIRTTRRRPARPCRGQASLKGRDRRRSIARFSKKITRSTTASARAADARAQVRPKDRGEQVLPPPWGRRPHEGRGALAAAPYSTRHLRLHRIGDEADFVGLMVQAIELLLLEARRPPTRFSAGASPWSPPVGPARFPRSFPRRGLRKS